MQFGLIVAVLGSTLYHISIKNIAKDIHPFLVLFVAYVFAALISIAGYFSFPGLSSGSASGNFSPFDVRFLGVALGVFGIEIGFLLAYRQGAEIGFSSLAVNVMTTMLLVPIGLSLFKESFTIYKACGVVFCLVGLFLLFMPTGFFQNIFGSFGANR